MRSAILALAVMAAFALTACNTTSANTDSPEYAAGYQDGCATGGQRAARIQGEPQRDEALYQKSPDYRAGWAAGYNVCGAGANRGGL